MLGKAFRLNEGHLEKVGSGNIFSGTLTVTRFESLAHFNDFMVKAEPGRFAACSGLPKKPGTTFNLVTDAVYSKMVANRQDTSTTISRTKEHFEFRPGVPGLFRRDYDYKPDEDSRFIDLSEEQLFDQFLKIEPEQANSEILITDSASSYIFNKETNQCLKGSGGKSIYTVIPNAADIPRYSRVIQHRLMLNNMGFFKLNNGKSFNLSLKTLYDFVIYQPNRLDFFSGSYCPYPLEQRRPKGRLFNEGSAPFNTFLSTINPLLVQDAKDNERAMRALEEPKALAKKELLIQEGILFEKQRNKKISEKQARHNVVKRLDNDILSPETVIHLKMDGDDLTLPVLEMLKDLTKYDGCLCLDPFEPDYRPGDYSIAIINTKTAKPKIHSYAHGGHDYWFPIPNKGSASKLRRVGERVQHDWKPMLSFKEAQGTYREIYKKFFYNRENAVVSGTGGTGKTWLILEMLSKMKRGTRVLFLANSHEKANEIRADLMSLTTTIPMFEKRRCHQITIGETLKGKNKLCSNKDLLNKAEEFNVKTIPTEVCLKCPILHNQDCDYVSQFDYLKDVSIMTHEEWNNFSSFFMTNKWNSKDERFVIVEGSKIKEIRIKNRQKNIEEWIPEVAFNKQIHSKPVKKNWIPDFIVVDESPIRVVSNNEYGSVFEQNHQNETESKRDFTFNSIELLLNNWTEDSVLRERLIELKPQIESEYQLMTKSHGQRPRLVVPDNIITGALWEWHLKAIEAWKSKMGYVPFSKIIDGFYKFVSLDDVSGLDGIRVEEYKQVKTTSSTGINKKGVFRVRHSEIVCGNNPRYLDIPTLIIDGTADETLYEKAGLNWNHYKVLVQDQPNTVTRQCIDKTVSRHFLQNDPTNKQIIVDGIKRMTSGDSVGVVTYKNVEGVIGDKQLSFDQWVRRELEKHYNCVLMATFGGLRGLNSVAKADHIITLGRHLNLQIIKDFHAVMYPSIEFPGFDRTEKPVLFRMKDGDGMRVVQEVYAHDSVEHAYKVSCKSETLQGVWRSRTAAPCEKDKAQTILTNECFGEDVAIDELFAWNDRFLSPHQFNKENKMNCVLNDLNVECFQWKKNSVIDLMGLTVRDWETRRQEVYDTFINARMDL